MAMRTPQAFWRADSDLFAASLLFTLSTQGNWVIQDLERVSHFSLRLVASSLVVYLIFLGLSFLVNKKLLLHMSFMAPAMYFPFLGGAIWVLGVGIWSIISFEPLNALRPLIGETLQWVSLTFRDLFHSGILLTDVSVSGRTIVVKLSARRPKCLSNIQIQKAVSRLFIDMPWIEKPHQEAYKLEIVVSREGSWDQRLFLVIKSIETYAEYHGIVDVTIVEFGRKYEPASFHTFSRSESTV